MLAIVLVFFAPILARAALFAASDAPRSWRDADWSSTGLLPPAADYKPARVVVFTGKAGAWKGVFSVHSWVVLKRANAARLDPLRRGRLGRRRCAPMAGRSDGRWYGNMPVSDRRCARRGGRAADSARSKPRSTTMPTASAGDYRVWPGPNSNSFVAAVLRAVPELRVALPPNAVGRDFRRGFYAGLTDSRTGVETQPVGASPASSSAGSRAWSSICSGWSPGSTCAIRR